MSWSPDYEDQPEKDQVENVDNVYKSQSTDTNSANSPPGISASKSAVSGRSSIAVLVEKRQKEVQSSQHEWWTYRFAIVVAWVVQILFTLATLLLLALWARHEHEEAFVVTFFVMAIAAAAYLAKVTGMGEATIAGRKVPIIRS